ncbi:carbohydrate ABC transporter permease [Candidatus Atribacteria bacterium 1244-E10-H5-B2]|nr:MAG: carbohydrate ABC transporter permease [Candidatus Atribacteria bacterium 1244-E10-H5-B2]
MAKSKIRCNPSDLISNILFYLLAAAMIFPFIWMVSTSLKLPQHILSWPPQIFPKVFTLTNYQAVFQKVDMIRYFYNTLRFTLVSTICIVSTSALAGYVFAKYRFPFKELIFLIIISTMMIPFQCYMVPLYMMMAKIHAVDTYLGLQLPYLVQAMGTFFMRQNFESLPDEYLEAARIEGASEWRIFFSIALPNFRSALGGLSIFVVSIVWGNLIWPLIITSSDKNFVLELGLVNFQQLYTVDYGLFTAAATVAIIPVVILFIIFRRKIIEGITLSGIK